MKRILIPTFGFLLLFFSSSFAGIKENGVEVRASSRKFEEAQPGKIISTSFQVTNHTDAEVELDQELTLPAGWQRITAKDSPLKLGPKEQQISVVAFLIPLTSPAGLYQISYSVIDLRDYNIADNDTISVMILSVGKLELATDLKPEWVLAGQAYRVDLRLVNRGNYRTDVKLQIKSYPDYPVRAESTEMALEAGSSRSIELEVKTDEKIKQKTRQILEITAVPKGSAGDAVSVTQTISVEIIPPVAEQTDLRNKIPGQMGIAYAGGKGKGNFQIEFAGRGSADREGKHKLDFLIRGPDIQNQNRWGKRDELRFSYMSKNLDLHLGDRSYLLSPLTDRQSYGRGAELDLRHGRFAFGTFYLKRRWGNPNTSKTGAFLSYEPHAKLSLKGNFMFKDMKRSSSFLDYQASIFSLQTGIKPYPEMCLNLEWGLSRGDKGRKARDFAFRMDMHGRLSNQIDYSLERIFSGPRYLGDICDTDYKSGTVNFPVYHKLRGGILYRDYKNNLDADSTNGTSDREITYQAGISYSLTTSAQISLDLINMSREDVALPAAYMCEESTVRLRLAKTMSKFSLSTDVERGRFEDKIKATHNDNLERYSLFANFTPRLGPSVNFNARIGHSCFTGSLERTKSLSTSSSWHMGKNVSLNLNYRWDRFGSDRTQTQNSIFSTLALTLPNNHSMIFRIQWSKLGNGTGKDVSFLAVYNLPLEIPTTKRKSAGVLKGRVYDIEGLVKTPHPKVVLTTQGVTAITDDQGEFAFPALEPGISYVQLERNSIGLDRVTVEYLPMPVEIKSQGETAVEIGVVRSCRISGRVKAFTSAPENDRSRVQTGSNDDSLWIGPEGEESSEKGNLENKLSNDLVELSDGKEHLRQLTDQNGGFSFEDLRPGKWILKIHDDNLPSHYHLKQKEFQIELKPGEKKEFTVRVLPDLRPIQIIDEGKIISK